MYKKIILSLFFIFGLNSKTIFAQVTEGDSLALVELFDSTDGHNWNDTTNWNNGPVGTWHGVTVSDGRVTSLHLGGNNLNGTIPLSFWNLTGLTYVNFYYNEISGAIPTEIENLTSLTNLDISYNQLIGSIPPEISNLENLGYLNLSQNQLTDTIPPSIGNLTHLYFLGLFNNQLTGEIPSKIFDLTGLIYLYLNNNQLSGPIPPAIGNLTNLQYLDLSQNELTGSIPPEIQDLESLTRLYLNGNQLSGAIPAEIGCLTSLTRLYLGGNQLSEIIPSEIDNLENLEFLYLEENQLSGAIPPAIGDLTNLEYVDFSQNELTDSIPTEIGNLTNLVALNLSSNQLSGSIPSEFGSLSNLIELRLYTNQLSGAVPPEINSLTNLSIFLIDNNDLVDLPYLEGLSSLNNLVISENKFTFEDIEPNMSVASNMFTYTPQDSVGEIRDTTANQGSSFSISVSVGGTNNQYQWKKDEVVIPGANSSTYTISSVEFEDTGSYICDISNTVATALVLFSRPINVTVVIPYITVTSPNGGENWQTGSDHDITWTSSGTIGNVQIEYSTNNGSSWTEEIASTPDDGTHSWTIPDSPSDNCLVRITDTDGSSSDTSDAVFTISYAPYITVTSPNGGENWYIGSDYNITWNSSGTSGDVKIEYSTDNGSNWSDVIASTPDDGTHSWTIPDSPSDSCLVRVSDTDGDPSDTSNALFSISPVPEITVTSPNGGEDWEAESEHNITWTSDGTSGNVKIEYSTNNGSSWSDVITSMPDTGAYPWTIPDTPSDNCLVRITDTVGTPSDTSNAVFTISPSSAVPPAKLPEVYSFNIKGITVNNQFEIKYGLPEKAKFKLEVYDIKGTKIKEISEENPAGFYSTKINMSGKPTGVYFIRIEANGKKFTKTNKVILVR